MESANTKTFNLQRKLTLPYPKVSAKSPPQFDNVLTKHRLPALSK